MANIVLDTSAIMAFFNDEPGSDRMREILVDKDLVCHMHAVNAIEVFIVVARKSGLDTARATFGRLTELGIVVQEFMSQVFQLRVAVMKNLYPALSLADSIALVLAEHLDVAIVTTDKEFNRAIEFVDVEQLRP